MLDEAEFSIVASKRGAGVEGDSRSGQYGAALAEYERITGCRETNFAAIWHHRLGLYGQDNLGRKPRVSFPAYFGLQFVVKCWKS